jgi:ParB-like chromosome segregation protein Spo0J
MQYDVSRIQIDTRMREADPEKVRRLADSIREIGLINPVSINPDGKLIAGLHRVEAYKQLRRTKIEAIIIALDPLDEELAEIDENLIRNEGTAFDQGLWLARRKEIYEQKYPETRNGANGGWHNNKGSNLENDILSFSSDAAKKTGKSKRSIERKTRVGEQLAPLAAQIKDTPLEDSQTDLLALAALAPEERPAIIEAIASGVAGSVKHALSQQRQQDRERQAQAAPDKPIVTRASWDTWLPAQPPCDLLLTDPPYMTDVADIAAFAATWLPVALGNVKPTGRAYVCIGAYPDEIQAYLHADRAGMTLANILVWTYRNTLGPTPRDDYKLNWQAVLYFRGPAAPPLDCPEMNEQFCVQDINAPDGRHEGRYHGWEKPTALAERFIRHSTGPGALVLDPFAGTGTFVLAAQRLGRSGRGCDIAPDMLALAQQRGCTIAE